MPDLSASWDIPNPFGLLCGDLSHDLDGYRAALGFLSDLAGGSDHDHALRTNGGDPASLRAWQSSDKFRRVYAKCRAAGEAEQKWAAEHAEQAPEPTDTATQPNPSDQRFVPLSEAPTSPGRAFSYQLPRESWPAE